ncbi:MAG: amino acid permease [Candidatus Eremiobacteraeota bacterium]|nr:amino acid permease [Candidatus Eremiobacteraeota bacterium]
MAIATLNESDRLAALGYRQELSRVLSLFDNFAIAFSYLSPMVGIYSLYTLGLGTGGPRYIWTIPVVVGCMLLVALVFGELASEYPLSGALYQYGKYTIGARYGWYVGWIYGFALLATVASVDSGAVGYVTALANLLLRTHLDPANHATIFIIAGGIIILSAILNSIGAKILGRVGRYGVYVETIGTFGVFIALAAYGFHQHLGFIFSSQGVERAAHNPLGLNFSGNWWTGAALVAILANVYIFYGFESAGDISEETVEAARQVPRAMRNALLYGGIASFVLVLGLVLATPAQGIGPVVSGGINVILGRLPSWLGDFLLVMVIVAFFSCGTAVQGAGARVAFALARDGALPFSAKQRAIHPRHRTPVNAILVGTIVPFLFLLLVLINPSKPVRLLWFEYPANVNALYALVSFATSGIYLAFLLTVLGATIARLRGWKPSGAFTLGRWGMLVTTGAALYLLLMLINIVWPSSLSSGRAIFNYGWITLLIMALIAGIGALYEAVARPTRAINNAVPPAGGDTAPIR